MKYNTGLPGKALRLSGGIRIICDNYSVLPAPLAKTLHPRVVLNDGVFQGLRERLAPGSRLAYSAP